jgi:hypothetical protein
MIATHHRQNLSDADNRQSEADRRRQREAGRESQAVIDGLEVNLRTFTILSVNEGKCSASGAGTPRQSPRCSMDRRLVGLQRRTEVMAKRQFCS